MNALAQLFASDQWTFIVEALLHTLWLGALAAAGLFLILRGKTDPTARHRWCVAALASVVIGGLVAWAILQRQSVNRLSAESTISNAISTLPHPSTANSTPKNFSPSPATSLPAPSFAPAFSSVPETWTPWLALLWLAGVAIMLLRAGSLVTQANQVRRNSTALENPAIFNLVEEARRKLNLARRIQVRVTDQLISPAVMGILTPILILPASLLTTLPANQIQMILLHELAHIRRGDYFINLLQLLIESLLFFNPAVWWISRQIRQEREACCDALASACVGEKWQYAQTLAEIAAHSLAAAPAFADRRNPAGLKDRIQRLLVPGYRPAMRLTWPALTLTLFAGGALLVMSALGTRAAVAAILSPQQRIARIEKKMIEIGKPDVDTLLSITKNSEKAGKVTISGHITTADGSPTPKKVLFQIDSRNDMSTSTASAMARDGKFSHSISFGILHITVTQTNFAPIYAGPFNGFLTNSFTNIQIVLDRGFDVPVQITDAGTGELLPAEKAGCVDCKWRNQWPGQLSASKDSSAASIILQHCADLPVSVTVNLPGYEITTKSFPHLHPQDILKVPLLHGKAISGTVLDKTTGQPIVGAEFYLRYQKTDENPGPFLSDPSHQLGKTDARGAFQLNQFRPGIEYYLAVSAPHHETVLIDHVFAGASNLAVKLGPELIVRGRFIGDVINLPTIEDSPTLSLYTEIHYGDAGYGNYVSVPLHITNGVAAFVFTNQSAGPVTFAGVERNITTPIDDWVVELPRANQPPPIADPQSSPTREVIFRFKYSGKVSPKGVVTVNVPDDLNPKHLTARDVPMVITNGEVRLQIPIGGFTSVRPEGLIGYWFDQAGPDNSRFMIKVTNGSGPMVIEIPLLPAGAIFAHAVDPNGSVAANLFFGLKELKHAPGVGEAGATGGLNDGYSDNIPRQWVSGSLPLGGTYQVYAWRGNSFCLGKPIKLTGANPDADVEIHLPAGQTFNGQILLPDKTPLANSELNISFILADNQSFTLKSVFTDERGNFVLQHATPEYGAYFVKVAAPGVIGDKTKLRFDAQPQVIQLKLGRILGGRVVQKGTGYPIPDAKINAFETSPPLGSENQIVTTDADGYFKFTTLAAAKYMLVTADAETTSSQIFYANGNTNLVITVNLGPGSNLQPKKPLP